jgi:hypothetical protein
MLRLKKPEHPTKKVIALRTVYTVGGNCLKGRFREYPAAKVTSHDSSMQLEGKRY